MQIKQNQLSNLSFKQLTTEGLSADEKAALNKYAPRGLTMLDKAKIDVLIQKDPNIGYNAFVKDKITDIIEPRHSFDNELFNNKDSLRSFLDTVISGGIELLAGRWEKLEDSLLKLKFNIPK